MKDGLSNSQASFEAQVLKALFDGFAEHKVRHAVLRNYEKLPDSVGARDIDIVVHPNDLRAACVLVAGIARTMGLRLANHFADERLSQLALVRRDAEGGLQQIKIDFFIRSEVYGIEVLSATDILADLRHHNGVPVVADHVLLLDKWLFHLLVGRPLHTKYDADFAAIAQREGAALTAILSRGLPEPRAAELVAALAAGKGSAQVLPGSERRRALARLWAGQGLAALPRSLRFAGFRLRDRLRPHGVFLSVSGPDGSGKTTVIEMVVTQLQAIYGDDAVHYAHFRPTMLPRIAEVAKKARAVETVDENYDRPHRAKPSGLAGSAARLAYYWLDYMGGYFRSVRPVLKRREVMLFDRYYYDMIADGFRSRIALPLPLLLAMGRILPLPDFAFFIRVDAQEIHRRKQELTMERIVALNDRYGDLVRRGWLSAVDNNGAPEEAAAAIVDRIVADRHSRAPRGLR
jgi:thymidylate kinase